MVIGSAATQANKLMVVGYLPCSIAILI